MGAPLQEVKTLEALGPDLQVSESGQGRMISFVRWGRHTLTRRSLALVFAPAWMCVAEPVSVVVHDGHTRPLRGRVCHSRSVFAAVHPGDTCLGGDRWPLSVLLVQWSLMKLRRERWRWV